MSGPNRPSWSNSTSDNYETHLSTIQSNQCRPMPASEYTVSKPSWMLCPPQFFKTYPVPEGVEILPISVGGRNRNGNKSECGQQDAPSECGGQSVGIPVSKCPILKSQKYPKILELVPPTGLLQKVTTLLSKVNPPEENRLEAVCQYLKIDDDKIRHHRDVFNPQLVVRKDGYMCPLVKKVECAELDKCEDPTPKKVEQDNCGCGNEELVKVQVEEDCTNNNVPEPVENTPYEPESDEECDDVPEQEDTCGCGCDESEEEDCLDVDMDNIPEADCPPVIEEEECVEDKGEECIESELSKCVSKFNSKEEPTCCEECRQKGSSSCTPMSNFLVRIQAPFAEGSSESAESVLDKLCKSRSAAYPEPKQPAEPQGKDQNNSENDVKVVEIIEEAQTCVLLSSKDEPKVTETKEKVEQPPLPQKEEKKCENLPISPEESKRLPPPPCPSYPKKEQKLAAPIPPKPKIVDPPELGRPGNSTDSQCFQCNQTKCTCNADLKEYLKDAAGLDLNSVPPLTPRLQKKVEEPKPTPPKPKKKVCKESKPKEEPWDYEAKPLFWEKGCKKKDPCAYSGTNQVEIAAVEVADVSTETSGSDTCAAPVPVVTPPPEEAPTSCAEIEVPPPPCVVEGPVEEVKAQVEPEKCEELPPPPPKEEKVCAEVNPESEPEPVEEKKCDCSQTLPQVEAPPPSEKVSAAEQCRQRLDSLICGCPKCVDKRGCGPSDVNVPVWVPPSPPPCPHCGAEVRGDNPNCLMCTFTRTARDPFRYDYTCPNTSFDFRKRLPPCPETKEKCESTVFEMTAEGKPVYEGGMCITRAMNFLWRTNPVENCLKRLGRDTQKYCGFHQVFPSNGEMEEMPNDNCSCAPHRQYKGGMDLQEYREFIWRVTRRNKGLKVPTNDKGEEE